MVNGVLYIAVVFHPRFERWAGVCNYGEYWSSRKWAQFNIATSEVYRNAKGEKVKETQWHRVVAWGKVAEITEQYLDKGREIAIEGRLVTRSYLDKDGTKKFITEVLVNELLLLGAKPA